MFDADDEPERDPSTDASEEEKVRAGGIFEEFLRAQSSRRLYDHGWWVCFKWMEGVTGMHYEVTPQRQGHIMHTPTRNRDRNVRPINYIGHAVDLVVAKQMKARPVFDCRPAKSETRIRMAARAARDLLRHWFANENLAPRRRDVFRNRTVCGNGFVKVRYDAFKAPFVDRIEPCDMCAGTGAIQATPSDETLALMQEALAAGMPPFEMPQVTCPKCQGAKQLKMGRQALGDVTIENVPPWEIYPAEGALDVTGGVFHAFRMKKEDAAAKFAIPKDTLNSSMEMAMQKSEFQQHAERARFVDVSDDSSVWVIEKWMPPAPGSEHPRLAIVVGNRMAWPRPGTPEWERGTMGETPEPYGRIPIFHFRQRPNAEEFWSDGLVSQMISANDFVNKSRGNFHAHQRTMAVTKWMVEYGSVHKDALTKETGEVVEYKGVNAPRMSSPATMPDFFHRLHNDEVDNIYKLAGLHDLDRGVVPPNIEAFQALHFLAEQSETVLGPIAVDDEAQFTAMARVSLVCALTNYRPTDKRMIRVSGQAAALEISELLQADLSDNVDVVCEVGSALAHSPALRTEQVYRGLERGMLDAPSARRLLEFGAILGEAPVDDRRMQEAAAYQEGLMIAQGQPHQMLTSTDDHEIHVAEHRRAALEAKLAGDMQRAQLHDAAAAEHAAILAPPAPTQEAGGGAPPPEPGMPFDSAPSLAQDISQQVSP